MLVRTDEEGHPATRGLEQRCPMATTRTCGQRRRVRSPGRCGRRRTVITRAAVWARTRQRSRESLSGRMMSMEQAANGLATIAPSAGELLYQLALRPRRFAAPVPDAERVERLGIGQH